MKVSSASTCELQPIAFYSGPIAFVQLTTEHYKKGTTRSLFYWWRRRRDYPEQPRGRSDPSGFAAHAARCQILLESYLVEPAVLIPFYQRPNQKRLRKGGAFNQMAEKEGFEPSIRD